MRMIVIYFTTQTLDPSDKGTRHEWHECDTSNTHTIWVRHERHERHGWDTNDTSAKRTKKFDIYEHIFTSLYLLDSK